MQEKRVHRENPSLRAKLVTSCDASTKRFIHIHKVARVTTV